MTEDKRSEREQRADAVICFLSLLIAALLTGMITWRIDQGAEAKLQEHLAGEVLRFHVLANSDSEEDQTLKLKVRDAVLDTMEAALPKGLDVEATKNGQGRTRMGSGRRQSVRSGKTDMTIRSALR